MGFGLWGDVLQKLEKILFKFFPKKAIEERIKAIVKISYANSDRHGGVNNVCDFTVMYDAQLDQNIQESEYLMGNPGKEKEKHNCQNYLENIIISWLVLLNFISLLQGLPNESITGKNDQKRKQETQYILG